eukprot:Clim_evm15s215 gene=Clim_evmTU15s215
MDSIEETLEVWAQTLSALPENAYVAVGALVETYIQLLVDWHILLETQHWILPYINYAICTFFLVVLLWILLGRPTRQARERQAAKLRAKRSWTRLKRGYQRRGLRRKLKDLLTRPLRGLDDSSSTSSGERRDLASIGRQMSLSNLDSLAEREGADEYDGEYNPFNVYGSALPPEIFYALNIFRIFGKYTQKVFDAVYREAMTVTLRKGQTLDMSTPSFYIVRKGSLAVYLQEDDGEKVKISVVREGEHLMSLLQIFELVSGTGALQDIDAMAEVNSTEVMVIPLTRMKDVLGREPLLFKKILSVMLTRMQRVTLGTLYSYLGITTKLVESDKPANMRNPIRRSKEMQNENAEELRSDVDEAKQKFAELLMPTVAEVTVTSPGKEDTSLMQHLRTDLENKLEERSVESMSIKSSHSEQISQQNGPNPQEDTASQGSLTSFAAIQEKLKADMHLVRRKKGAHFINAGERLGALGYIVAGSCSVNVPDVDTGEERLLYTAHAGEILGQMGYMSGEASIVNIRAETEVVLLEMSDSDVDRHVVEYPYILYRLCNVFSGRLAKEVRQMDFAFHWLYKTTGEYIYKQGDDADAIYIVLSGRLRGIMRHDDPIEKAKKLRNTRTLRAKDHQRMKSVDIDETKDDALITVIEYGRGEVVGELELLTNSKRASSVKTIRDTELAMIPRPLFDYLRRKYPEVMMYFTEMLGKKLMNSYRNKASQPTRPSENLVKSNPNIATIAVVPIGDNVPLHEFVKRFEHSLNSIRPTVVITMEDVLDAMGKDAFAPNREYELIHYLSEKESGNQLLVYLPDTSRSPVSKAWTQRCIRQADLFILVARGNDEPRVDEVTKRFPGLARRIQKHLVLLHPSDLKMPTGTREWLRAIDGVTIHHHIRVPESMLPSVAKTQKSRSKEDSDFPLAQLQMALRRSLSATAADFVSGKDDSISLDSPDMHSENGLERRTSVGGWEMGPHSNSSGQASDDLSSEDSADEIVLKENRDERQCRSDMDRCARRLLGKAIGVVLGGGGARGVSHVGLLHVLTEENIPVDMVGGTSMGAMVAAIYAQYQDMEQTEMTMRELCSAFSSLRNYIFDLTYPTTAMMTGRTFNAVIHSILGNVQIEDLWVPFFCTSTDISSSKLRSHEYGCLWRYCRASMTLAGYFPPITDPETGALLVDGGYLNNLPADIMAQRFGAKIIIAHDIGAEDESDFYNYGDDISGWYLLANRYNPFSEKVRVPNLDEIQSRLAYAACAQHLEGIKANERYHYLRSDDIFNYSITDFQHFNDLLKIGYTYSKQKIRELLRKGVIAETHHHAPMSPLMMPVLRRSGSIGSAASLADLFGESGMMTPVSADIPNLNI